MSGFGGLSGGFNWPDGFGAAGGLFFGNALGNFSSSNKVLSAAGGALDWKPGRTLYLILHTLAATAASWEVIVACYDSTTTKGWQLLRSGTDSGAAGRLYLLTWNGGGASVAALAALPTAGICQATLVWKASNGSLDVYIGGASKGNFSGPTTPPAVQAAAKVALGSVPGGTVNPATTFRILAAALVSGEATAAQVATAATTTGSRFKLASSVTTGAIFSFNATDYNASGFTSGGSTPVTFVVSGSPTNYTIAEKRYTAAGFLQNGHLKIATTDNAGNAWTVCNSNSVVAGSTKALAIGVEMGSNNTTPSFAKWGQWVGNTFTELSQGSASYVWTEEVQLGSTETTRAWQVVSGSSIYNDFSATTRESTSVQAVRVPVYLIDGTTTASSSVASPSAPQTRLVLLGDSIEDGFVTSQFAHDSPAAKLRAAVAATVGVTSLACGFETVYDLVTNLSQTVARVVAECDGTVANWIVLNLGTNDYGDPTTSAATFGTNAATLIDTLYAALVAAGVPNPQFLWITPIQRIAPATEAANSFSNTLGDYRSQITPLTTGRAWLTVTDGAAGAVVSNANMYSDGIHVVTAGAAQIVTAIRSGTGV